jgi:DNA-binding SARP family transcriptional activator
MEFKVLGAFEADIDGISVLPSAAMQRRILALLVFYANQPLPVTTLMKELWGEHPPRTSLTTVQTYILGLRRRIDRALGSSVGRAAREVLLTCHGGYVLQMEPDSGDVHHYDRWAAQGQRHFEEGDYHAAARCFRDALDLWRGPALVDIQAGEVLETEKLRLEESRLGVLERRIEADLRLGRHADLLTELTVLTNQQRLHEGLHAQLMAAFYRSGRPAASLEVFKRLRAHLIDELGVEPSPRMQRLHQAVLSGDPTLDVEHTRNRILDLFAAARG